MRIIYFSDTFLPKVDGIAVSIKNFSELLSEKGHEFIICSPGYGKDDFSRLNDKVRVERFSSASLPSYPDVKMVVPSPNRIKKLLTDFNPDLIHIHTPGILGQYALTASEKYGIPVIGTYHTLISEQESYISIYRLLKIDKFFSIISRFDKLNIKDLLKLVKTDKFNINKKILLKLCNYFYDKCDRIVSPSFLLRDQLMEFGIKKPIHVISNGMDLSRFTGSVKELPVDAKILHVGRISYEKNCDVVINAFQKILQKLPGATLTIIGDGPALSSLKRQARQMKLEDKIHFTGFIPHAELHNHYPQYDLFLTASTMETQGLVVLEAIACGLPAVGVDAYAIPELIHENKNGFNAKPFQVEELADKAMQVLTDAELYQKFSQNSIEISKSHELSLSVDKMEDLYQDLAERSKRKKKSVFNILM